MYSASTWAGVGSASVPAMNFEAIEVICDEIVPAAMPLAIAPAFSAAAMGAGTVTPGC